MLCGILFVLCGINLNSRKTCLNLVDTYTKYINAMIISKASIFILVDFWKQLNIQTTATDQVWPTFSLVYINWTRVTKLLILLRIIYFSFIFHCCEKFFRYGSFLSLAWYKYNKKFFSWMYNFITVIIPWCILWQNFMSPYL